MCGIYLIRNTVNGKVYVGSSLNIKRRWYLHTWDAKHGQHHSQHFQRAWDCYGESVFEFSILEETGEHELTAREMFWSNYYRSGDKAFGYNIDSFTSGRKTLSIETRNKISATKKAQKRKLSAEHIAAIIAANTGHKWCLGRKCSDEHKAKVSASLIGNKRCVGHKLSEEHKAKISATLKKIGYKPTLEAQKMGWAARWKYAAPLN